MTTGADHGLKPRLERLVGARVTALEAVAGRGYTQAGRHRATLDDARTVFVKSAVDELTAGWLRLERVVYEHVEGPFLPELIGFDESEGYPLLVLEDLTQARWPPPWSPRDVAAMRTSLAAVAATRAPAGLTPMSEWRDDWTAQWALVAADPEPFLSLGLCSRDWLAAHLPTLREAALRAPLAGTSLVHLDVRSDNTALVDGRAVLVDWNWASEGNPLVDLVGWCPSLAVEGGPAPEEIVSGEGVPELAALLAGVWAAVAALPAPPTAPNVRDVQRAQLGVCFPWACRGLGLPAPG